MARRGSHEGWIYKRADGRWVASISLGIDAGGKRKSYYGKTRAEVQRLLTAALRDRDQGMPIVAEQQTVAHFLDSHLTVLEPKLKPRTHLRYCQLVNRHALPAFGKVKLARLTAQQIQDLYASKLREGLSPTTVHQLHVVLRSALKRAVRLGLVVRNVTDLVDAPRPKHTEICPLTREQARLLLQAARGDRLEALYALALATGMRQGELLALKWREVDLEGQTARVRATVQYVKGKGFIFHDPKTRTSRRTIHLSPPVIQALRQHRARQAEERLALGVAWQGQDLVFTTQVGTPIDDGHLLVRQFRPLLERAGLPRIRFHDLRHTAATLLLAAKVNPKVVPEMLGHSSVAITLDIYSHVLPDMQQDAAEPMAKALYGG